MHADLILTQTYFIVERVGLLSAEKGLFFLRE